MMNSFWGVFWVDASTEALAAADFFCIADSLQISTPSWRDACRGLSNLQKPWLLILDNADDRRVDYQCYFPSGTCGITLVTSRNSELRQHATSRYMHLDQLSDTAAQTLLLAAAGPSLEQYRNLERDAAKVARLLASHPLAIIQAGAYISREHCTVAQYPQVYERQRQQLLCYRPSHAQSRYGDVYTTFEASADILQSSKDEAASDALQLLPILATLSSSRLPLSLFGKAWQGAQRFLSGSNGGEAGESISAPLRSSRLPMSLLGKAWQGTRRYLTGSNGGEADESITARLTPWHISKLPELLQVTNPEWNSFRLLEAIYLLKAFSLVATETYSGGINVSSHPLIHAWARDRQSVVEQHQGWLTSSYLVAACVRNYQYWLKQGRRLQPHLQALVSRTMPIMFAHEPPRLIVSMILNIVHKLHGTSNEHLSLALMEQVCAHLGLDATIVDGRWRLLYYRIAEALIWCDQPTQALGLLEQILTLDEQTSSADMRDRPMVQHNLAIAYGRIGATQKAVEILEDVVRTRQQTVAGSDRNLSASQYELAVIYRQMGRIQDAIVLLEPMVKRQEKTLDEEDVSRAAPEHELALCYGSRGLLTEAYDRMKHVVDVQGRVSAQDHANILLAKHELAGYAWELGYRDQAYDLIKDVVDVRRRALDENDTTRLTSEHNLAVHAWDLGYHDDAYDQMNHVVSIRESILDESNPDRLKSEDRLSIFSWDMGRRDRAHTLMQHVVDMRRLTLATDDARLVRAETWVHYMEAEMQAGMQAPKAEFGRRSSLPSDPSALSQGGMEADRLSL